MHTELPYLSRDITDLKYEKQRKLLFIKEEY